MYRSSVLFLSTKLITLVVKNHSCLFVNSSTYTDKQIKVNPKAKLAVIKAIHTTIWVFYNVVIFYLLYAVIVNKIDKWVWICISLVFLEIIILIVFKRMCPVTLIARKYSDSGKDNFDIYLPNWLAKNNKLIYSIIFSIGLLILVYRLLT